MARRHRGRRGHALRRRYGRAGRGGVVDEHAQNELDLYAENTSELYNQKKSILANIQKKAAKGVYDPTKAAKLWMYWVTAAAQRYQKEFGSGSSHIFNKATREALAKELEARYPRGQEG
jgi:hypothetical protein